MDKIKIKRKNRFINISEEESKLKKYKRNFLDITDENYLLSLKQISNSTFGRKIILPIIILFIILISTSSLRKKHKQNYLTKLNIINKNKLYGTKYRIPRKEALKRGRNYLDKCLEGLLFTHKEFTISNEPKITVIIPVYNGEKMIKSVIRSIQNQNMIDIEIILINDYSNDNSLYIMEEMKKEDPRIKIINNEKNMGILYSRSVAVLEAKGKYILNLDHDDFFLENNLFEILYEEAEIGNFDIISFMDIEIKSYNANISEMVDGPYTNRPNNLIIHQPELSYFTLFENESFKPIDPQIWGKLIKTEIYKKAINLLGKERYSIFNIANDDLIEVFALSSIAQNYKFVRVYGIFHFIGEYTMAKRVNQEYDIKMTIFFAEIVFDLSKKENKKYAVDLIIKIIPPNEDTKVQLGKVLKKIIDCKYIHENYKEKIRQKYKDIGFGN